MQKDTKVTGIILVAANYLVVLSNSINFDILVNENLPETN